MSKLWDIKLQEKDLLVSSEVMSLFTRVPGKDTQQVMSQHIPAEVKDLIRHVLTTTYFLFDGTFYELTNGVAMGSPLAPIVVKIYMKKFEQEVLSTAKKQSTHWYRNVDDTFWPHGKETLPRFSSAS